MRIRHLMLLWIVPSALLAGQAGAATLTDSAAAAVEQLFPGSRILGVGLDREHGLSLYEVTLQDGGRKLEVEVSAEGSIVETESVVSGAEIPKEALLGISSASAGETVRRFERHEVRGVVREGKVVALASPIVFYEAKLEGPKGRREVAVTGTGGALPAELGGDESKDDDSGSDSDSKSDGDGRSDKE